MTIRSKITALICITAFIALAAGVGTGYVWGRRLLRDTIGSTRAHLAETYAYSLEIMLNAAIRDIKEIAAIPSVVALAASTSHPDKTDNLNNPAAYYAEREKQWKTISYDDAIKEGILDATVSNRFRQLRAHHKDINEILLTDKTGGLVAASGKVGGFYYVGKEWWKKAFAYGEGELYIGHAEFDALTGRWVFPFAVPVRGKDGSVMGIMKISLDIDNFLKPLENFAIGKTGRAILIDKNTILFAPQHKTNSVRYCSDSDFERLVTSKNGYLFMYDMHGKEAGKFVASATVRHPGLLAEMIILRVIIEQDTNEFFMPLRIFMLRFLIIFVVFLAFFVMLAIVTGVSVTKPVNVLKEAMDHFGHNDLAYRAQLHTHDELEDLAVALNTMASNIQQKQEELTRVYSQLMQSEKMSSLGTLAAGIVHEINNPLSSLTMSLELVRMNLKVLSESFLRLRIGSSGLEQNEKEIMRYLQTTEFIESSRLIQTEAPEIIEQCFEAVNRITATTKSLKEFAHPPERALKPVDLNQEIEKAIMLVWYQIKTKCIVEKDLQPLPPVTCNAGNLNEVFVNLLINSFQAIEKKGVITVRSRLVEGAVVIEFSDTGSGIDSRHLDKIFEPFFTTKPKGIGTGLGLSLAHSIIEQHGGDIRVSSAVGVGTTFTIVLPLIPPSKQEREEMTI